MSFNQQEFNNFIVQNNVIGFFEKPITLKSGRTSNWYVNWRTITNEVQSAELLAHYIMSFVKEKKMEPDCFYGVPEGATKIGLLTQYLWAKKHPEKTYSFAMGRANPKIHGATKDKYFVGEPKGKTIILEDVTTTGGSLISTIKALQETGTEIMAAIGLTNRNELRDDGKTVQEAIESLGIPYYSLSSAIELLPNFYHKKNPGVSIGKAIEKEFAEFGTEKIILELLCDKEQKAKEMLCLPLDDLHTLKEVEERVNELQPYVGLFKVGKELFTRFGPEVVKVIHNLGGKVFLDLKYHDIPNTVKGATRAASELGVYMINLHALGTTQMMKSALEGAKEGSKNNMPKIIGVTILTSIGDEELKELSMQGDVASNVLRLAKLCASAGCDGIVCSAMDLENIKKELPKGFMYITPGITGVTTSAGKDQKRIMTPANAIRAGSSILVVGRAITAGKTKDERIKAAKEILADMAKEL